MMGPMGDSWWPWGMGLGWVFMLAFWVLIIIALVALVRWAMLRSGVQGGEDSALRLLRERYARGEISREEFLRMREDLSGEG